MKSASNPGSARERTPTRRAGSAAGGTQWWKAWLLLTSLGATVLGWVAFPQDEQQADSGIVSPQMRLPAEDASVVRVDMVGNSEQPPTTARALPTMPQKPVFRAPVTRTRRS